MVDLEQPFEADLEVELVAAQLFVAVHAGDSAQILLADLVQLFAVSVQVHAVENAC